MTMWSGGEDRVSFRLSRLHEVRPRDLAIRFAFGAAVSFAAAAVGRALGARFGGLFLAFPAILPATLTLLESNHDRRTAVLDDRGAAAGVPGLAAFAVVVGLGRDRPALALPAATLAWLAVSLVVFRAWMWARDQHAEKKQNKDPLQDKLRSGS